MSDKEKQDKICELISTEEGRLWLARKLAKHPAEGLAAIDASILCLCRTIKELAANEEAIRRKPCGD